MSDNVIPIPKRSAPRIELPPQLVAGIVRHLGDEPARVVVGPEREEIGIKPASCYAFVSRDAEVYELQLLLEQVLDVLASKGGST